MSGKAQQAAEQRWPEPIREITPGTRVRRRPPPDMEEAYRKLGRYKGLPGTPEAREQARRFWIDLGLNCILWLLNRIRDEHSVDVVDTVVEIVGEVGSSDELAAVLCLHVLEHAPSETQVDAALTALRWMAPLPVEAVPVLRTALTRFVESPDPLIQEKAVLAARCLPDADAETLYAATYERVADATRELIDEERVRHVLER